MRAPAADIDGLRRAIDGCMLADRPALHKRLKRAAAKRYAAKDWQRLKAAISHSSARRSRRRERLPCPELPPELPIAAKLEEIRAALANRQVIIVCGDTGSGKTTQLPKLCLAAGRGVDGLIGHTQPRRVAARAAATRVADELDSPLGAVVGYQTRFEERFGADSYIKVMTDGIVLAELQHDRLLRRYDTLIVDEAHERSLNVDFLLGYLKRILPRRPELKLIVTSATIDPERFSRHFGDAPVIEVSGRSYPVEARYRPRGDGETEQAQAIVAAVDELTHEGPGDILVFLPGEREIRQIGAHLRKQVPVGTRILPLYARLSAAEQNRVFEAHNERRIVLATNVAETSLTVPGIRYVVDPGTARISRYSLRGKIQRLPVEPISQASAHQRMGRCGRTAPGVCIRLYSQTELEARPAFTEPELQRTSLAAVILQMAHLGLGSVQSFPFMEPPERKLINDGYNTLAELGAIDAERRLTEVGTKLARLSIDPRLARMLLAASDEGAVNEVLVIASALAIEDPRERPLERREAADAEHARFADARSDFLGLWNLWVFIDKARREQSVGLRKLCRQHFLSHARVVEWREVHAQLRRQARRLGLHENSAPAEYAPVHRALLAGLPANVGRRDEAHDFVGARDRRFSVFPGSALSGKPPKWIMAAELAETTRVFARTCAAIKPQWVEQAARHLVKRERFEPHWQPGRGRVAAYECVSLYGLVLIERRRVDFGAIDPAGARAVFVREALVEGRYHKRREFLAHNQALIDEAAALESRKRRRDILVDASELHALYASRLPDHIHDGAGLERWLASDGDERRLFFDRAEILRAGAEREAREYPTELSVSDTRLTLRYRFEPGSDDDGVTLRVPLALLNRIDAQACEWLVPGLLEEKFTAMIKGLPKALRRHFVPAPELARACAESLSPADGSLRQALTDTLQRMTGTHVPPEAWPMNNLPSHLRMRFEVIDTQDGALAADRDLAALKSQLAPQAAASLQSLAAPEVERSGITDWDLATLPKTVTVSQQGAQTVAYFGLTDEGDSVAVRVFDTAARAEAHTREGVRRLAMLRLRRQAKDLRKRLPGIKRLCLAYRRLGSCASLTDDLVETAFDRALFEGNALPRDAQSFEAAVETARARIDAAADSLCAQVGDVLELYPRVRARIDELTDTLPAAADLDEQLTHLVYPGFVREIPSAWLQHIPRYLQAMATRLDKLSQDPRRDAELQRLIEPHWRRYRACRRDNANGVNQDALQTYRWMLEEYRVSLFAQRLGAAIKVSDKRLEGQWQRVAG